MKDIMDAIRAFRRKLSKQPKKRDRRKNPKKYRIQLEESRDRKLIWDNKAIFSTRREKLNTENLMILNYLCTKYIILDAIRRLTDGLLSLYSSDTKDEAFRKRDEIIENASSLLDGDPSIIKHIMKIIKRLQSDNFPKTLTFMEYENLDSTTNQVERTNRWFRKRQKTHYRNRKEENIVNMLKADLIGQMERYRDNPPVRLGYKALSVNKVA